jgi:hypothetical protein
MPTVLTDVRHTCNSFLSPFLCSWLLQNYPLFEQLEGQEIRDLFDPNFQKTSKRWAARTFETDLNQFYG